MGKVQGTAFQAQGTAGAKALKQGLEGSVSVESKEARVAEIAQRRGGRKEAGLQQP